MDNKTEEYRRLLQKIGAKPMNQFPQPNPQRPQEQQGAIKPVAPQQPKPIQKQISRSPIPRRGCNACRRNKGK